MQREQRNLVHEEEADEDEPMVPDVKDAIANLPPGFADAPALDNILQYWADERPEAAAIKDPSNRRAAGLGALRKLDYWSLNKIVSRVAALFTEQGLGRGDIVAIQLANTVECPITVLAAMRAGLVPCILPLLWRRHELESVFSKLPVKAIICQGDEKDHSYGEMMRDIAANHISVRFLYGAGMTIPDGIMPLNEVFERPAGRDLGRTYSKPFDTNPNDPAVILWGTNSEGMLLPLWRTHEELSTAGVMHVREARITCEDRLLNPFPLSSLTGLAAMFSPWLLAGASMVQHEPFEEAGFLKDLADNEITYALLPAPIFNKHYASGTLRSSTPSMSRIGCVWSRKGTAEGAPSQSDMLDPTMPVLDIFNLADITSLIVPRRGSTIAGSIPLGPITFPSRDPDGPVILETSLKANAQRAGDDVPLTKGSLRIRGPLVPDAAYAVWKNKSSGDDGAEGWLDTGVRTAILDEGMNALRLEQDNRFIYHGGVILRAEDLDKLYSEFENFNEAAAFTIEDPLMGDRIFAAIVPAPGYSPSMSDFRAFLAERSVAPYKKPEKLVVVSMIPRDDQGRVLRDEILNQI